MKVSNEMVYVELFVCTAWAQQLSVTLPSLVISQTDVTRGDVRNDMQYIVGLNHVLDTSLPKIDIQYFCYDTRDNTGEFWISVYNLGTATMLGRYDESDAQHPFSNGPDWLETGVSIANANGQVGTGNLAFFVRGSSTSYQVTCGVSTYLYTQKYHRYRIERVYRYQCR